MENQENRERRTFSHYLETEKTCVYGDDEIICLLYKNKELSEISLYNGRVEIEGDKSELETALEIALNSLSLGKERDKDRRYRITERLKTILDKITSHKRELLEKKEEAA